MVFNRSTRYHIHTMYLKVALTSSLCLSCKVLNILTEFIEAFNVYVSLIPFSKRSSSYCFFKHFITLTQRSKKYVNNRNRLKSVNESRIMYSAYVKKPFI